MSDTKQIAPLRGHTLLVVGAGGFIGGHICAEGLRRGMAVTAAVRSTTSLRHLKDPRLRLLTLDYDDPAALRQALAQEADRARGGGRRRPWDYVVYNLGATKALTFPEFNLANFEYLRRVAESLKALDIVPDKLLYMSSLSAVGPGDESGAEPLRASTPANPDTRYGLSKVKAEQYLTLMAGIPYVIFRPTGVYGPHEKDYLMMVRSIDRHVDFAVGFKPQWLTFIYVADLVNAIFDALASPRALDKTYIVAEERPYTQAEFRRMVARALGRRWVLPVKLPLWALYAASYAAEKIGRLRARPSTLNRDKYRIMRQRNWRADASEARADFGFHIDYPLERGVAETVRAYREGKKRKP